MQPSKATRRGSPLLMLAALLVLSLAAASAAQKPRPVFGVWTPIRRLPLDTSSLPVQRAAQTAVNYYNYKEGWPGAMRAPGLVKKAHMKFVPGVGRKYVLQFATKDLLTQDHAGTCEASVLYLEAKPKPTVDISCSPEENIVNHLVRESRLFGQDKEPDMKHLVAYGIYGSSLIAWEQSSEDLSYVFSQFKNTPRRSDYDTPEVYYDVLLVDPWKKSSLPCQMRITWGPVKVKYFCSPEDGSSESADGSGGDSGSTDDVFDQAENNV